EFPQWDCLCLCATAVSAVLHGRHGRGTRESDQILQVQTPPLQSAQSPAWHAAATASTPPQSAPAKFPTPHTTAHTRSHPQKSPASDRSPDYPTDPVPPPD